MQQLQPIKATCPYCGTDHKYTVDAKTGIGKGKDTVGLCTECANVVIVSADRTEMRYPSPELMRAAHHNDQLLMMRMVICMNAIQHNRPRPLVKLPDDFPEELCEFYDNQTHMFHA